MGTPPGRNASSRTLYERLNEPKSEVQKAIRDFIIEKAGDDLDYSLADPASVNDMAILAIDIMNLHFSQVGLPITQRPLVWALIGMSQHCKKDQDGWFEAADKDLARRLIQGTDKKIETVRRRIQRQRKGLIVWQTTAQQRMIEIVPGYGSFRREDGEIVRNRDNQKILIGFPCRYRLPLLAVTLRVIFEYQTLPFRTARSLEVAARKIGERLHVPDDTPLEPAEADVWVHREKRMRDAVNAAMRFLAVSDATGEDRGDLISELVGMINVIAGTDTVH